MVLEANMDVLISLRKFYENLLKNKNFDLKEACEEDILQFATQVNNMINDSRMQIERAKLLVHYDHLVSTQPVPSATLQQ